MNPVSAGLVDDPAHYGWSGHREIIGKGNFSLVDPDEVLMLFGDTRRAARRAYVKSLHVAGSASWIGEEPAKLPWWRSISDEAITPREGSIYVDYLGRSTAPERPRLSVEDYLGRACRSLGVEVCEVASRRRDPAIREIREAVAVVGVEKFGQRVREMALALHKNPGSVSRWVSNAAERRLRDSDFTNRLRNLEDALLKESSTREQSIL